MNTEDVLFIALMNSNTDIAWYCRLKDDNQWFACGLRFFRGMPVVKFLPIDYWHLISRTSVTRLEDGYYTEKQSDNIGELVASWIQNGPVHRKW